METAAATAISGIHFYDKFDRFSAMTLAAE
jgi:hypothetical protein